MKTVIVIILGLMNLLAWWVAYENRASEKVLSAFASISVGALGAVLLAVFVFAEQPSIRSTFPVSFYVDSAKGTPINVEARVQSVFGLFSLGIIPAIYAKHPAAFSQKSLGNTYHQILQRVIIDWMVQVYRSGWQVTKDSYDLPAGNMFLITPAGTSSSTPTVLDSRSIADLFSKQSLGREADMITRESPNAKLILPPNTKITVIAPHEDSRLGEVGEIWLRNRYVTISVGTRYFGNWGGIGEYAVLSGYDNAFADKILAVNYELTFAATFPGRLSGNPDMPSHRAWAEAMLKMFQDDYDEQAILRNSRIAQRDPKLPPDGRMTSSQ